MGSERRAFLPPDMARRRLVFWGCWVSCSTRGQFCSLSFFSGARLAKGKMLYATSPPPRGTQRPPPPPPPPPLPPSLVAMRTEGEKPSLSRSDFFHAPGEASSFLSSHICCVRNSYCQRIY